MVLGLCETEDEELVSAETEPSQQSSASCSLEPETLTRSWSEVRPHTETHVLELIHQLQGGVELEFNMYNGMNLSGKCTTLCHTHSCWLHLLRRTHKCFHSDVVTLTRKLLTQRIFFRLFFDFMSQLLDYGMIPRDHACGNTSPVPPVLFIPFLKCLVSSFPR